MHLILISIISLFNLRNEDSTKLNQFYCLDSYFIDSTDSIWSSNTNNKYNVLIKFSSNNTIELKFLVYYSKDTSGQTIESQYTFRGRYLSRKKMKFVFIPLNVKLGSLYRNISYNKITKRKNNHYFYENSIVWKKIENDIDSNLMNDTFGVFASKIISAISQDNISLHQENKGFILKNVDEMWFRFIQCEYTKF